MTEVWTTQRTGKAEVKVYRDLAEVSRRGAEFFTQLANLSLNEHGRFAIALSGGSTPRTMYSVLANELSRHVPWERIDCFWSDERCVPPDHPDSNYRMANEALLSRVNILAENVHRMRGEDEAARAAAEYERELRSYFRITGDALPRFDLIMLGLGPDGHTASLFPGTVALTEQHAFVAANYVEKLRSSRLTLTFPVLNAAAVVMFLVAGEEKADALDRVLRNDRSCDPQLPAQEVHPENGRLLWIVDQAAAKTWVKNTHSRSI